MILPQCAGLRLIHVLSFIQRVPGMKSPHHLGGSDMRQSNRQANTNIDTLYSIGGISVKSRSNSSQEQGPDSREYYYQFLISERTQNIAKHEWPLPAIPFEMPVVPRSTASSRPKYIYGCSARESMFGAKTGEPMKIDCLVKINSQILTEQGINANFMHMNGLVDHRSVKAILSSSDPNDPIKVFPAPRGCYAQEPSFAAKANARKEDDGYLLCLMFDESQLDTNGIAPESARRELWIINAQDMSTIISKIFLPQRVPYGFHGAWFTPEQIKNQRSPSSSRTARFSRF